MRIIRIAIAIVMLAAPGMMMAITEASAEEEPKHGGILTYAVALELPNYDCHAADGYQTIHVLAPHYSTLLRMDPAHYPQIMGDLAESWEVKDNRTYIFHLYPGIRFHDGSPLTSTDVKVSLDRVRNPPPGVVSIRQPQFADVTSIETPDDRTVVIRTEKPDASLLTILASPWNCIYSAKLLKENPDYPAKIVMGSGPFRFVEHVAGSKWVGRRFENYFRPGLPYLDGFEAYFISRSVLTNALEGGQVMAEFVGVSPVERDGLVKAMGDKIKFGENRRLSLFQLTFNTTHKPFDDIRVRRALSLAIDRWSADAQFHRTTVAGLTGGLLPPGSAMARSDEQLEKLPGFSHDAAAARAEARDLLKQAGQENLSFTLTNLANFNPFPAIGIYVIDQWRQVGVSVQQNTLPAPQWLAARPAGNFDVAVDFVGEFTDDPTLWFAHYLSHDHASANFSHSIDRTLDDLFDRQLHTPDLAERSALVHAFEDRVLQQAYVAPVSWGQRIVPLASKVMGYIVTPSIHADQDLMTVWLDR